jgi:hypothetical protein
MRPGVGVGKLVDNAAAPIVPGLDLGCVDPDLLTGGWLIDSIVSKS